TGEGAVVDGGDDRAGDRLANLPNKDGRSVAHEVRLEAVATSFVEEHATEFVAHHYGHRTGRRRGRVEQGGGALGGGAGILGGRGLVEELEAALQTRCLHRGLDLPVALGDRVNHQPDPGAHVGVTNAF